MYQMNYKTLEKLGEYLSKVQEKDITAEKRKNIQNQYMKKYGIGC